jgi:hypothetical protein
MKTYFSLIIFILLIAFCNSSKAQVHKLTYREAYNFNVGDEIYTKIDTSYYNNGILFYQRTNKFIKTKIIDKKTNPNQDTLFYTQITSEFTHNPAFQYIPYMIEGFSFTSNKITTFYITNLDDTIIPLNGYDTIISSSDTTYLNSSHNIDSNLCNKASSNLSKKINDTTIVIEYKSGIGRTINSSYFENSKLIYSTNEKIIGYFKLNDSCGNRLKEVDVPINYVNNSVLTSQLYDISLGDEYCFERKIEGIGNELIKRKVVGIKINSNNEKEIQYQEELFKLYTQNNSINYISKRDIQNTIKQLDTTFISSDNLPFDYNFNIHYSTQNILCNIQTENFLFDETKPNFKCCGGANYAVLPKIITHQYIKGLGFLENIHFSYPIYGGQNSPSFIAMDTMNYRDTAETLLYIKNKFYNCGEMPDIFKRVFKNETENYVNIVPNPVQFGEDVFVYKSSSANISSISFTDELGRFLPTVQKPTYTEKELTFTIPHQYFHIGLNIVSFQFDDGHQEIHKIIVY